ncbi:enoyl-CoA hydratase/isomerase family protein [Sphingoaurantiacus capsulatus]|uniref:Enoyl-CoA hydratase/isomerase family protein n=1 Tax=Sphingoaurantiacus capsulatus TaxID=1771310 RepID=A0ABV7XG92_9SPHN
MSFTTIDIERREGIEIVTLNRPDALNTLDSKLVEELTDYFLGLHERYDVRVVIMRGAGRAFCAGLDLKGWASDSEQSSRVHRGLKTQQRIARIIKLMRSCPQPVVGLGHGAACGGGLSLLLACDVRYGAPSLRMNAAYIKVGLGGADIGSSYLLPRLVGMSVASELLLTGRFINAERALRANLLSEIVEEDRLLDTGLALAADMLATAPMGLRMTKDALNLNIDASSLEAAMAIEDRQQIMMATTADHGEAVAAFLEKRPPNYQDR